MQWTYASSYFPLRPAGSGKNVVIEGNRRLAAVRILLTPEEFEFSTADIPEITAQEKQELSELPVVIGTRGDSWRYLGFKHVNGPAKWSSYAKARYIADVVAARSFRYGCSLLRRLCRESILRRCGLLFDRCRIVDFCDNVSNGGTSSRLEMRRRVTPAGAIFRAE